MSVFMKLHKRFDQWAGGKASEKFGDGFVCSGDYQLGANVGERLQDEAPLGEPGMREGEFGALRDAIPGIEEIKIEGAGGIAGVFGGAAQGAFDLLERMEKRQRFAAKFNLHDRVEIRRGAGFAIDRLGFVNR